MPSGSDVPCPPSPPPPAPTAPTRSLIALGFILPTLHIFLSELRMRRALLEQRRAAGAAGGAAAARARLPSPGTLPGLVEYALFAVPAVAGMWSFVVV